MGMIVGCASQHAGERSAPAGATAETERTPAGESGQAAAPQAASQETSASATEPPANGAKAAAAFDIVALQKAGYKIVNENGTQLYCKREVITGSRLQSRTRCYTAAELEQIRTGAQEAMSDLSRRARRPGLGSGG